ncbi:UbiA prenyltransferase family [Stachybotrys elegans]|uniref:Diterpenoid pyrone biosynthesis cluster protein C n=1 Tax=Stachybotrys elegans TaxID=80388 RepID=A0A8K0T3W1_9HYPO|nr:UbiA prenyltransferase family [Stachybotrys elegans]
MGSEVQLSQQYGGSHGGGWVSRLPSLWIPYVQLARLSPPAAILLIYIPHVLGLLHAASIQRSSLAEILRSSGWLFVGTVFFSNAAHAWNDLIDSPFDKLVARTKTRPIPRGAISEKNAFIFATVQAIGAALVLLAFPSMTGKWAIPNIFASTYYPWAKRHTHGAQLVLGFCLGWGVIVGATTVNVDPSTDTSTIFLFVACLLWTGIYDTIYAHQDYKDDMKLGLKSLATLLGKKHTKAVLYLFLVIMLGSLAQCGILHEAMWPYHCLAVGGSLVSLGTMITYVQLENPKSCWKWFSTGFWGTGGSIAAGLIAQYATRH